MSNLSDLLNDLGAQNSTGIKLLGDTLGTIADLAGAVGGVISGVDFVLQMLNLAQSETDIIISEIEGVYHQLTEEARGQDIVARLDYIASVLGPAQTVVQSLKLLITAQPPLTRYESIQQIEQCLTPLNILQDAAWALPSADPIYWTDFGEYLQPLPGRFVSSVDVGYGECSPAPDPDDLVFNYTYLLPAYLNALVMFITVAACLDTSYVSDYAGTPEMPGPLRSASSMLSEVHSTIQGGITRLSPGPFPETMLKELYISQGLACPWTISSLYLGIEEELLNPVPTFWTGVTWALGQGNIPIAILEYGAVDIYSGFSSMANYVVPFNQLSNPRADIDPNKFNKFRIRLLRRAKQVYNGIGMMGVWDMINSLRLIVGDPPQRGASFGYWSFREIMGTGDLAPESDGNFSLMTLAGLIKHTFPIDTDQMLFATSFQELLTH